MNFLKDIRILIGTAYPYKINAFISERIHVLTQVSKDVDFLLMIEE